MHKDISDVPTEETYTNPSERGRLWFGGAHQAAATLRGKGTSVGVERTAAPVELAPGPREGFPDGADSERQKELAKATATSSSRAQASLTCAWPSTGAESDTLQPQPSHGWKTFPGFPRSASEFLQAAVGSWCATDRQAMRSVGLGSEKLWY